MTAFWAGIKLQVWSRDASRGCHNQIFAGSTNRWYGRLPRSRGNLLAPGGEYGYGLACPTRAFSLGSGRRPLLKQAFLWRSASISDCLQEGKVTGRGGASRFRGKRQPALRGNSRFYHQRDRENVNSFQWTKGPFIDQSSPRSISQFQSAGTVS